MSQDKDHLIEAAVDSAVISNPAAQEDVVVEVEPPGGRRDSLNSAISASLGIKTVS